MGAASDALRWFQEAMSERPDWEMRQVRYKADGTDYDMQLPFGSPEWQLWRESEENPAYMRRNDQINLHDLFLEGPYNMYLDSSSRVWQSIQIPKEDANTHFEFQVSTGLWFNRRTGLHPTYFHNGPCKWQLHDTSSSLNRVRNSILRTQLKRRGRWSDDDQERWLSMLPYSTYRAPPPHHTKRGSSRTLRG